MVVPAQKMNLFFVKSVSLAWIVEANRIEICYVDQAYLFREEHRSSSSIPVILHKCSEISQEVSNFPPIIATEHDLLCLGSIEVSDFTCW
jgi:hypothetical protein